MLNATDESNNSKTENWLWVWTCSGLANVARKTLLEQKEAKPYFTELNEGAEMKSVNIAHSFEEVCCKGQP